MGRAVLHGELATTLWNQPYNGALDAYLLAPLLAVLPHHAAYRLYQVVCAVLLVWLVALLARRLAGPQAAFAGALVAAWGTPYMALMTATGPPPNFLMPLVTGFPLLIGLDALARGATKLHEPSRRAPASCSSLVLPAGSRSGTRRSRFRHWPAWPPASPFRGCDRAFAPPRPSRRAWPSASFRSSSRGSSARAERASRRPRARSRRCGRSGSGPRGSPISATRSRASSASRCPSSSTAASARRFRRSWWRFSLPRCSRPSSPRAARGASPRSSAGRRRSRAPSGSPGGPGRTTCAISTGSMHRSPRSWARASPRCGRLAAPGVPWPVSRSRSGGASAPGRWRAPGRAPITPSGSGRCRHSTHRSLPSRPRARGAPTRACSSPAASRSRPAAP